MRLSLCLNPRLSFYLFIQLIDLSELFLSTDIEFLRSALSHSEGSVQAICVPSGTVRKKKSLQPKLSSAPKLSFWRRRFKQKRVRYLQFATLICVDLWQLFYV